MKTIEQKTKTSPRSGERETEKNIAAIKKYFAEELSKELNLIKTEAPLILERGTGTNDDLNGVEKPVNVDAPALAGKKTEIVQSLAKWKREKLARLQCQPGEGIYTDMRALRPDEILSDVHSVYVDQWDWEKTILASNRNTDYLEKVVEQVYAVMVRTQKHLAVLNPSLKTFLPREIVFVHAADLQKRYPLLSPKERENEIAKRHGAVFITGIGATLADGKPHDGRAPDYDDWISETSPGYRGLNGDIVVWNPVLQRAFEISSMGIRVSPESLLEQLEISGHTERADLPWHKKLLSGQLPYSVGGGIGQSRLAMLLLGKKHIGEVQSSVWPETILNDSSFQIL